MSDYLVYFIGPDGHFINFKPLICASDDEALAEAKELVDGHDIELWSGPKLLQRRSRWRCPLAWGFHGAVS
jgi:hypothetical protein